MQAKKNYSKIYISQNFRKLFWLAIDLKEAYDKNESRDEILSRFERYYNLFLFIKDHTPEELLKGSSLLRHSLAMNFWLVKRNDPNKCYKDICSICHRNLIEKFQTYLTKYR